MKVSIHPSWETVLQHSFEAPYFEKLVQFVKGEYQRFPHQIFPEGKHIFRAFNNCPFDEVKVVILGQDPYPKQGEAHGLSFSCESHVKPLPASLQNIFAELEDDLGIPAPPNGDLNHWAEQGVLLLNTILTVRENQPNSHKDQGWERFTDEVIEKISIEREGVVFMLWGTPAKTKGQNINRSKHLVLESGHPSPKNKTQPWFGNKHFSQANQYLKGQNKPPIKWA